MKKIIYILLTGLALFYGVDSVYGETCYYEDDKYKYELNTSKKGKTTITDFDGKSVDPMGEKALNWKSRVEEGDYSVSSYGNTTLCPAYILYASDDFSYLYVSNSKTELEEFSKFYEEQKFRYVSVASKKDGTDSGDWSLTCIYHCDRGNNNFTINYSESANKFSDLSHNLHKDVQNSIKKGSCPPNIFVGKTKIYNNESSIPDDDMPTRGGAVESKCSLISSGGSNGVGQGSGADGDFPVGDIENVDTCEALIGQEVIEELNNIMFYIRIAVPILLLVFGALDFGTAVLSADDGGMKKAQGKFIKRLIIGVAVFFVPTIVNLVIHIMNTVWGLGGDCGIR